MYILVMKRSREMGWQLGGDMRSLGNIRAYLYAKGHKPVDPERLVALEGLTYRSVFGKRKGTSYILTGKCR